MRPITAVLQRLLSRSRRCVAVVTIAAGLTSAGCLKGRDGGDAADALAIRALLATSPESPKPESQLRWALESLGRRHSMAASTLVADALLRLGGPIREVGRPGRPIAVSRDGRWAVIRSNTAPILGHLDVLNLESGEHVGTVPWSLPPRDARAANAIAFSPDSRWIAGVSRQERGQTEVVLWDVDAQVVARRLSVPGVPEDGAPALAYDASLNLDPATRLARARWMTVAFSNDGQTLAAMSNAGDGVLWELASGRVQSTFTVPWRTRSAQLIGFSRKDESLLGHTTGALLGWKRAGGRLGGQLRDENGIADFSLSSDGGILAVLYHASSSRLQAPWASVTGGRPAAARTTVDHQTVRLVDPSTLTELRSFTEAGSSVALSPDGRRLAIAGKHISIWETGGGRHVVDIRLSSDVSAIRFSPDGSRLAAALSFCTVVFDAGSAEPLAMLERGARVSGIWWTGARRIISGDHSAVVWDPDVTAWEGSLGRSVKTLHLDDSMHTLAYSSDGRQLLVALSGGPIRAYDVQTGEVLSEVLADSGTARVVSAAFSPNGRFVAIISDDGRARVLDVASGREQVAFQRTPGGSKARLSRNGEALLLPLADAIGIFDAASGRERIRIPFAEPGAAIAISPDGRRVYVNALGFITAYDATSGRVLWRREKETDFPSIGFSTQSITVSMDGRLVAASSRQSYGIEIRHSDNGRLFQTVHAPPEFSGYLQFSPDGTALLGTMAENHPSIWSTSTGAEISRLAGLALREATPVSQAVFSPDGTWIATASGARVVIQPWKRVHLIELGCARVRGSVGVAGWRAQMGEEPYQPVCGSVPSATNRGVIAADTSIVAKLP